jgi:hypothetical protein
MLMKASASRRPTSYLAAPLIRAMQSTTSPTTPPKLPAPACRWKRGRPVSARYASTESINGIPPWRLEPPSDNRDVEVSSSDILQPARLEVMPRQTNFKPTARMQAQYVTSTVRDSKPEHLQSFTRYDTSDTILSSNCAEKVEHGTAESPSKEKIGTKEGAESSPVAEHEQANIEMEQSSDFEFIPSQDSESSTSEQLNPEEVDEERKEEKEEEEAEEHITLDYQIPEEVLRAAMLASPNTRASFWSSKMYRGPDGQQLSMHYCQSMEVAERVAQYFLKEKVVGFDIEWRPYSSVKNIKENASLVQLACEDRIALFHISQFAGSTPEELMPPTLKTILENPDIYKVGVAVKGDFTRLRKYLNIQAQGVFELSRLHNLVEWHATDPTKVSNKLTGLAAQVLQHLQLPLYKGAQLDDDPDDTANVRESDWSKPLDLQQIHYAAADAYAGFRLFHMLEWKRKQLRPTPPVRGICDYDPKPVPKSEVPKKKKATGKSKLDLVATEQSTPAFEQEQESDQDQDLEQGEEGDGYETAPEELIDSHELEDPVSKILTEDEQARRAVDNRITRTQKHVGRVNLSWLTGPDPGYPTLPKEPDEDAGISHSSAEIHQEVASTPETRLSQLDVAEEDDDFEDPELEAALQVMDLDEEGKLKSFASTTMAVDASQKSGRIVSAVGSASSDRPRTEANGIHDTKLRSPKSPDTSDNTDLSDYNPLTLDTDTETPTTASPLTFRPLTQSTNQAPNTPEYQAATTWAQNHLQSTIPSPTSKTPSRIRATIPHLRAYHLWYHQNLPLDDIARHLRDPPLSHSTVTGYILQAVSLERLEYDRDAMRDVMMGMPTALRKGRWRWMAEKVGAMK